MYCTTLVTLKKTLYRLKACCLIHFLGNLILFKLKIYTAYFLLVIIKN